MQLSKFQTVHHQHHHRHRHQQHQHRIQRKRRKNWALQIVNQIHLEQRPKSERQTLAQALRSAQHTVNQRQL